MNSYEFISLIFKCSLRNCFKFSSVSLYDSFFYYAMPSKYKLSRLYLSSRSRSFFHHYWNQLHVPYWCNTFECYLISKLFEWCLIALSKFAFFVSTSIWYGNFPTTLWSWKTSSAYVAFYRRSISYFCDNVHYFIFSTITHRTLETNSSFHVK